MRVNRWGPIGAGLLVAALVLSLGRPGTAAQFRAQINPGVGIGPLMLGMRAMDVPRALNREITPKISEDRVIYDVPALGFTAWATDGYVVKIRTTSSFHKTPSGIHPGRIWNEGMVAMCAGMVLISEIPNGLEYTCPFVGIGFEVV
ncbi:MAG: hypothetical protein ACRDF6_12530, partial [bacterium]